MSTLGLRYTLIGWWLVFAYLALQAGRVPGLVDDPESVPYPWLGVATTWLVLAVAVAILYAILRSRRLARWWLRLGAALLYASVLVAITFLTFVTDMAGLFYVPGQFALATFVVLAIVAVGSTIVHAWRKWLTG